VRYKGTKTIAITPDFSEVAKLSDQWLAPKQGTDSALAMAMGHVILKTFHLDNPSDYFLNYCRTYTDMPMLVMLERREEGFYVPGRMVRAADLVDDWAKAITRSGKPSPITALVNWWRPTVRLASAGERKANGTLNSRPPGKPLNSNYRCWIAVTTW
jgi:nitrate reductase alpha subunit